MPHQLPAVWPRRTWAHWHYFEISPSFCLFMFEKLLSGTLPPTHTPAVPHRWGWGGGAVMPGGVLIAVSVPWLIDMSNVAILRARHNFKRRTIISLNTFRLRPLETFAAPRKTKRKPQKGQRRLKCVLCSWWHWKRVFGSFPSTTPKDH